ncbi:MAG: oxidoreductase, partial [Paracoccaceae bacterium]
MRELIPLLSLMMLCGSVVANELGLPEGEVLLTISGNTRFSNSEHGAQFDLGMLEQLGATSITTETPWTDGPTVFTGVRLNVLMKAVGAGSSKFRA